MKKGFSLNWLVVIAVILLLMLTVGCFSGVKEGYMNLFVFFIFMGPFMSISWRKSSLIRDLAAGVVVAVMMALAACLFWKYQDSRDAWFSFENTLKWGWMGTASGLAFLLGFAVRWISARMASVFKSKA